MKIINKTKLKKGFTLIELLAIIIILSVIIAIATPGILNIIVSSEKKAFEATARHILGAVTNAYELKDNAAEYYYVNGKEFSTAEEKLYYEGTKPTTGRISMSEQESIGLAIYNGKYCATKAGDETKVNVTVVNVNDCITYNIIETSKTWQEIAIEYDTTTDFLLGINEEIDINSITTGRKIKVPIKASSIYSYNEEDAYVKTYYTINKETYNDPFTPTTKTYTIDLEVLPIPINSIHSVTVKSSNVFSTYQDFTNYAIKNEMLENSYPIGQEVTIGLTDPEELQQHSLNETNLSIDDVSVSCTTEKCSLTIIETTNNVINSSPYINDVFIPIKVTIEFNGEPDVCQVTATDDTTPGSFTGTGTSANPYLIESIEDLVYLSNTVNAGTTYSSKYLKINQTVDFSSTKSYKDYQTTAFGDINGNGTVEELKTELTTSSGFIPIGNSTNRFNGILSGNDNCIKNLYINRPTTDYVGFIGYNEGTVSTLFFYNLKVTGQNITGGISGHDQGDIIDSKVTGNITGGNKVGGVIGDSSGSVPSLTSLIVNANVTGIDEVGGIAGHSSYANFRGIVEGGSIIGTGTYVNRTVGKLDTYNYRYNTLAMNNVTVNGVTNNSTSVTSSNGMTISSLDELNDINFADTVFDTYIGGDNDANGWYWDYDESYETIVHKRTIDSPLTFTLTGSGTNADPYLINNASDLKMASLRTTKSYKLLADIDLNNIKYYMLGTYNNTYSGTFYGNNKTISNLTISIPNGSYVGFIGKNEGTIKELNINNFNIRGKYRTGGIAGYSNGNITLIKADNMTVFGGDATGGILGYNGADLTDISFTGDVTGDNQVGGIIGDSYNLTHGTSLISNANVIGINEVGGILGQSTSAITRGIMESGSVIGTGTSVNRIIGNSVNDGNRNNNISMSTVTVNGITNTSTAQNLSTGSTIYSLDELNEINLADTVLDTYIGGDNDGNGWYWDYDETYSNIIHKNITESPLTFTLTGSGTTVDPYLINNATELKMAASQPSKSYKLMANIDLTSIKYYMLGTRNNSYTGTFYGNNKYISNLIINVPNGNYIGFVGVNGGTIEGLNLNADIICKDYCGGIIGYNDYKKVLDSTFNGSISGNNYVGLIAGSSYAASIKSVIVSGTVSGANYVGAITGNSYGGGSSGISHDVNITTTGVYRNIGTSGYSSNLNSSAVASTVLINGNPKTSTSATGKDGLDITAADLLIQTTYTDRGFNFTDETLDYIWYLDGGIAKFREGNL